MGGLSPGTNGRFVHPKHPWVSNQEAGELMGREAINRYATMIGFGTTKLHQEPHDGLSWRIEFRGGCPWDVVYIQATTPSRCFCSVPNSL